MHEVGWLDKQPQMKPQDARNPNGFDYQRNIEVLREPRLVLPGGGELEVSVDYPPTECGHMTTVYVPELGALFTSDLCYHGVHAWAGTGVLREHIANGVGVLGQLKARYTREGLKVYPGHGDSSDASLFDMMRIYLNDFVAAVDGEPTNAKVTDRMRRMYPGYAQEEFLLAQSVAFHGPDANPRRQPRREKSLFK